MNLCVSGSVRVSGSSDSVAPGLIVADELTVQLKAGLGGDPPVTVRGADRLLTHSCPTIPRVTLDHNESTSLEITVSVIRPCRHWRRASAR